MFLKGEWYSSIPYSSCPAPVLLPSAHSYICPSPCLAIPTSAHKSNYTGGYTGDIHKVMWVYWGVQKGYKVFSVYAYVKSSPFVFQGKV